jgi:hypothetical protein
MNPANPHAKVLRTYHQIFKTVNMKPLKLALAALFLTFTVGSFAASSDFAKKKKKHKCNTECNATAHKYMHGEKKHKCADACHKMMDKKM